MKNKKIWLSEPSIGLHEIKNVRNALKQNWLSSLGSNYIKFKLNLKKKIKCNNLSLVNSGTSAIHLALKVLEIKKNDIVLCQSFTFIGSINPIKYCEATPVFIDSEKDTWNIDPSKLEEAIKYFIKKNNKPKAIILVHIYGIPCKIDEIKKIAKVYKIPIIEDAAEAFGSTFNKKYCGTIGDIGIFSFNANKILTCAGGGALTSNKNKYIQKIDYLSSQAKSNKNYYHHTDIGYNYRLDNISASIGLGQLKNIDRKLKIYYDNYISCCKIITNFDFVSVKKVYQYKSSVQLNHWLIPITFNDKILKKINIDKIITLFGNEKIQVKRVWKPIHMQPIYKNELFFGNMISEKIFKNSICLPNGLFLKSNYFNRLKKVLKKINKFL